MNAKQAIYLAASTCLLGFSLNAYANPTVYGKANVSLNKHDAEDATGTTEDRWKLNSNALEPVVLRKLRNVRNT